MGKLSENYSDIYDTKGGFSGFIEVGYYVLPNVSANIAVLYSSSVSTEHTSKYDVSSEPICDHSLTTSLLSQYFKIKYYLPTKQMNWFLGGGIGRGSGKSVLIDECEGLSMNRHDYTAKGTGFLVSLGTSYYPNRMISISVESGYRYFVTDNLKDEDGNIWVVQGKDGWARMMNLNYSGIYWLWGLYFKLW